MQLSKKYLQYSFISLVFILQSCATALVNLTVAKDEVRKYHESGRYDKETAEVVNEAIDEFNNVKTGNI